MSIELCFIRTPFQHPAQCTIANVGVAFGIHVQQNPEARSNGTPPENCESSLISNDTLMALYRNLLRITAQAKRQKNAACSPYSAAQVAMEMDLQPDDAVRIAIRQAAGRSASRATVNTHNLIDVLGMGVLNQSARSGKVVVLWAAQADPAILRAALEAARQHKLPIIFLTEAKKGAARLLNRKVAPGEEMPHITVDGNDVIASYRVAHEAIERARRGRGASLIECTGYRVQGKRSAKHLDPVANLESYLKARGLSVPPGPRKSRGSAKSRN